MTIRSPTRKGPDSIRRPRRDLNGYQRPHGATSWLAKTTWDERARLEELKQSGDDWGHFSYLMRLHYNRILVNLLYPDGATLLDIVKSAD